MSYQDPNQSGQYGGGYSGYTPPGGHYGQEQPGGYQQQGYQEGGYQQPYGTPPVGTPSPLGPSSTNIDPKVGAGLSYLLGLIGGIVFFVIEKQNRFVRFHAMQSILLQVALTVLFMALAIIQIILIASGSNALALLGILLGCLWILLPLGATALWIVVMVFAFQGKYFKVPLIGAYAERFATPSM